MGKSDTLLNMKYIIYSIHCKRYFAAIHSYTAMYFEKAKARQFDSAGEARAYALEELFTRESAFIIETV